MHDDTRKAMNDARAILKHGLARARRELDKLASREAGGFSVSDKEWEKPYETGLRAARDLTRIAALEQREERRPAQPSAREAANALHHAAAKAEAHTPAPTDDHAPGDAPRPKLHSSTLVKAVMAAREWAQLAVHHPPPPLPPRVRKVLPALGIAETTPEETMHRFLDIAPKTMHEML